MNTYLPQAHSHVLFHGEAAKGSLSGPCPIILHTGSRVWVMASYIDVPFGPIDGRLVGDGKSNGFDQDGQCIVSIHINHVEQYLTDEEAQDIVRMMDADEKLLSHAR